MVGVKCSVIDGLGPATTRLIGKSVNPERAEPIPALDHRRPRRWDTELEAVRNDITEAREYPQQPLGIDLMSSGHWPHDRMASTPRRTAHYRCAGAVHG